MLARPPRELLTPRVREAAREVARALEAMGLDRGAAGAAAVDARLETLFALSPYVMETCRRRPAALARLLAEGALERGGASCEALVTELVADAASAADPDARPDARPDIGLETDRGAGGGSGAVGAGPEDGGADGGAADDGDAATRLAAAADALPEPVQLAVLRAFRHRHMVRILWRELERAADLDATLADLSALAEACIRVAARWATYPERRRHGTPRDADGRAQSLLVLGMGKLGAGELNVSSDVDLICLFPAAGQSDGRRPIDAGEFFTRVVRRLARLLGTVTGDGFAYRVDLRLRPFGESGPLAMSLDAFEHYLLTQGRDWERYAMVKARALSGEALDVERLAGLLRPFVYRRYLDFDALESLAELKGKIHRSLVRRARGDDIKLGPGGIRELEFTAQAYQLVRGGREPRLQRRPVRPVLAVLGELGLLEAAEARALIDAYEYLRRVENALQGMRDEQTHVLPSAAEDRARLVAALGASDWAAFAATLDAHRVVVRRAFAAVLGGAGEGAGAGEGTSAGEDDAAATGANGAAGAAADEAVPDLSALVGTPDDAALLAWLERSGVDADAALRGRLVELAGGAFHRRLSARGQSRVERILPRLVRVAGTTPAPAAALARALGFTRAVAGRSGYLQVLIDRPAALARLMRLFAASAWLAALVTRHPIVVDELLGEADETLFAEAGSIREEALAEARRLADWDLERQMDAMRHFQQSRELRVAAAALDGKLTAMQASDRLSWLAEAVVAAVLELVAAPLARRHALPDPAAFGIAVVAYGKLGGLELGFGADLDLVFLRREGADGELAARLVRRIVQFCNTATPAGRLYELDLRLRPNGASGVLVGTIGSFERYQRGEAWTWEHQALLRARPVLGDTALCTRFETLRLGVLCAPREREALRADVAAMRERMRTALGTRRADAMHLKQDPGGIADIEFIVQYLALAHAAAHPSLVRFTDNVRVLAEAGRLGLLTVRDATELASDYVELRERLHRRALELEDAVVVLDEPLERLRERVLERRLRILDVAPGTDPS